MGLFSKKEKTPAATVIEDVLGVKKNEKVLIIANPETNVIAQELYTQSLEAGASPVLMFQQKRDSLSAAEKAVIGALSSGPDVICSISALKLGSDSQGEAAPYKTEGGESFDNIFDYLIDGKKTARAIWTPGLTEDMFRRTVNIDYKLLGETCRKVCKRYEKAVSVHVTSPNGTDVTVPVQNRSPMIDNGDFSKPGTGGNIPSGEVFISPVVGSGNTAAVDTAKKASAVTEVINETKGRFGQAFFSGIKAKTGAEVSKAAQDAGSAVAEGVEGGVQAVSEPKEEKSNPIGTNGVIVFDGSLSFSDGDALLEVPVTVKVKDGFVTDITGGDEARRLQKDITAAEKEALAMEISGKLPEGQGAIYSRNARNIGELGIGLNPSANVTGNMLEDEKAFRTCHFAIGRNYDGDAPSLIHFDGIVRNPTIVIRYEDGTDYMLMDKGDLKL